MLWLTSQLYEDVEGVELPPSLVEGGVCWKRPADLYEVSVLASKSESFPQNMLVELKRSKVRGPRMSTSKCCNINYVTFIKNKFGSICTVFW